MIDQICSKVSSKHEHVVVISRSQEDRTNVKPYLAEGMWYSIIFQFLFAKEISTLPSPNHPTLTADAITVNSAHMKPTKLSYIASAHALYRLGQWQLPALLQ